MAHESIIGEEPTKHWIRIKEYCELRILCPEMVIKEEAQPSGNKDRKKFEHHIKKLLDLGCIEKSKSTHRSPAFIVNKHSEISRGESRVVINLCMDSIKNKLKMHYPKK